MNKEKIKFSVLIVVIVVIMFTVYMKVNTARMNKGTCVNGMTSEIVEEKKGQFHVLIDQSYKTSNDKCVVVEMKLPLNLVNEKIVFKNGEEAEYSSKFQMSFKQDEKQNTLAKKDIKLITKYATLDQNILRYLIEVEVVEQGKVNTYEIKDEILLHLKEGKITEGE